MTIENITSFEEELYACMPPNHWQPAILILVRAWYSPIRVEHWRAGSSVEFDFEEDSAALSQSLALLGQRDDIDIKGDVTDWKHANLRRTGPSAPPPASLKELRVEERDIAEHLLMVLDTQFSSITPPSPLVGLDGSQMVEETDVFNALDWDTVGYGDWVFAIEGWICAPFETKLWLLPKLYRMALLNRNHAAVDDIIGIYVDGFLADHQPQIASHLSSSQSTALNAVADFYTRATSTSP